jgi:hypothetical protein
VTKYNAFDEVYEHRLQRGSTVLCVFRNKDYVYNISLETGHSSVYERTGLLGGDSNPCVDEV